MSVKTTQIIKCDHIQKDGYVCGVERTLDRITTTEPMYHLSLSLDVIDANGTRQMTQEDVHLCYWDLYYHLAELHERAKADIERQAALAREAELPAANIST